MKAEKGKMPLILICCASLVFLFGGCTSGLTNSDIDAFAKEAETTLECSGKFYFYTIPSQGGLNDMLVVGISSVAGPSNLARELAGYIGRGDKETICLAVTGASTAKTTKSILDALAINKSKQLTKLKFMYIGTSEHKEKIREAVESLGAKFYFRSIN